MSGRQATIFDIPAFYASSVPPAEYSDGRLRQLSDDIFTYLLQEIRRIEDQSEVRPELEGLLDSQLDTFMANVEAYKTDLGDPFMRKIRTILRPIEERLDELGMGRRAKIVHDFQNSLQEDSEGDE